MAAHWPVSFPSSWPPCNLSESSCIAFGADVLLITSPNLPALPSLDVDTSRGKRTTQLDLKTEADRAKLHTLVKDADVFLQAYRPGGLRDKGLGVEDVVKAKPGIVYASLCAYGWEGPWKNRRGFDSLTQTATGFNVAEGEAYAAFRGETSAGSRPPPKPFPMQALDHAAGYLLAFGINTALARTITEGGSWEVRVSLAAVGQWIRSLGQVEPSVAFSSNLSLPSSPQSPEIVPLSVLLSQSRQRGKDSDEPRKTMTAVKHSAVLSQTPVLETFAPIVLNANNPTWGT